MRWAPISEWSFQVNECPKAQPRASASFFRVKPRYWTPRTADAFKQAVGAAALEEIPKERLPIRCPVSVQIVFWMPRPARLMTKKTIGHIDVPHIAKPDKDNLEKAVADALENAGVLTNDSIVFHGEQMKLYANAGEAPRAVITVSEYGETHG
jgi:Holliday junction resolvase RusA-like endonuclease